MGGSLGDGGGERWDNWKYTKAQKKDGARVYIAVAANGEVTCHEGYLTHDEIRRAKAKKDKEGVRAKGKDKGDPDAKPKSPITNAMRNYLDLHRHAAVRLALIARPADALRLLIAHAVAASGNWTVRPDSRRADSKAIGESVADSQARTLLAAEAKAVAKLLAPALRGLGDNGEEDGDTTVAGRGHQDDGLTVRVFERLLKLKDAEVGRIGAFVMAETLASGSAVADAFGAFAKVELRARLDPGSGLFRSDAGPSVGERHACGPVREEGCRQAG